MDATVTLYLQTQLAVYHAWLQHNYPILDGLHYALPRVHYQEYAIVNTPRWTALDIFYVTTPRPLTSKQKWLPEKTHVASRVLVWLNKALHIQSEQ